MKKILFIVLLLLTTNQAWASVLFNGTNQNLYQGTGFTLGLSSQKSLTLAAWVDITGVSSGQQKIFGKSTAVGGNQTFNLGAQDCGLLQSTTQTNTLCVTMGTDNNSQNSFIVVGMTTSTIPELGVHHIVAVWNNTSGTVNDWTFYIDNVAQSHSNSTFYANAGTAYSTSFSIEDLASTLYIGSACGDTCPSEWFPGYISEIYVSLSALNSTQIGTLYNGGVFSPCSKIPLTIGSPILYMPLDDFIGGQVIGTPNNYGSAAFTAEQQIGNPTWNTDMECNSQKSLSGQTELSGQTT